VSIRTSATSDSEGYAARVSDFEFVSAVVAHRDHRAKISELVHQTSEGALTPRMDSRLVGGGAVKHRSPLVTLAAVFVAFAIMFTVDMLSGPPGKSSAGTADAPVASARGSASSGHLSRPRPPSSRLP
jgi:hypothetical protein